MEIETRLEITIPMCNCAAEKNWKRSVAWFSSYRAKCAELQLIKTAQCFYVDTINFKVAVYYRLKFTRVLVKKAAWKLAKTVGKDSGYKSRGLHWQKYNCVRTGSR